MKSCTRFAFSFILVAAAVAMFAGAPGADSAKYLVLNDNDLSGVNYGTILKLAGTARDPVLDVAATLNSQSAAGGGGGAPAIQVVREGSDTCVFMTDYLDSGEFNQMSSFKYPGLELVANYSDPQVPTGIYPYVVVASGGYIFEGISHYIASWQIGPGCTLSLLQTTHVSEGPYYMDVTPNGKTLVSSNDTAYVDSFSIGPNGVLTEMGPVDTYSTGMHGLDITADGLYAIFAATPICDNGCTTYLVIFTISSDGSLENERDFGDDGSLGDTYGISYVRLSPSEKFLFASGYTEGGVSDQLVTLNFTETPLKVSYSGCTTTLNQESNVFARSLATVATSGSGKGIYVAESNAATGTSAVGLLDINSSTGCTTEVPMSPFPLKGSAALTSLIAWPPRPF